MVERRQSQIAYRDEIGGSLSVHVSLCHQAVFLATLRVSHRRKDFVSNKQNGESIGSNGSHQSGSGEDETGRSESGNANRDSIDRLKAELGRAFSAPEEEYKPLTVSDVIARNRE
ncbi:hypothetical protein [Pseudoruegeria sp. SHC-113]|uniref:hypothetical protein n=1 Tax=Pseudoruegeria sp. SHC-113 TaxID=2855439 RepID=UPI0021BAD661|nr:hypothetical protein [Pseudoruegeria sp. SHC-113]